MGFQETSGPDPARRVFVSYIDKSREFYRAQGFEEPYRWAYNTDAPFAALTKPLAECRLGLITTTMEWADDPPKDLIDRPPGQVYAKPVEPPPERMYTDHLSWDKGATHTEDVESFLPIRALQAHEREGRIGSLSPRFYGVPTEYSQRKTRTIDAPAILSLVREDAVDVALLVPL